MPVAYVAAGRPYRRAHGRVSVILAGVLLKMGGYGLLRMNLQRSCRTWRRTPRLVLACLAAASIIYGAVMTLIQTDLKRLIAYSSVSHMGYVLLGASALGLVGLEGASMQMFTHGLITGMLFVLVGMVYDRAHTREIGELSGLAHRMPFITVMMLVAGLASLGLPAHGGLRLRGHRLPRHFRKARSADDRRRHRRRVRRRIHPLDDPAGVLGRANPALG